MNEKSINVEDAVLTAPEIVFHKHPTNSKGKLIVKEDRGSSLDVVIAIILFVNSFLFLSFFDIREIGWQQTVFTIGYILISVGYVVGHKYQISKRNVGLLVFILIACIPNAIYANPMLKLCNLIFIHALQFYWMLSCCRHLMNEQESDWVLYDAFVAIYSLPKVCFTRALRFITTFAFPRINMKIVWKIILGLLVSIPLLMLILPLLLLSDTTFQWLFLEMALNVHLPFNSLKILIMAIPLCLYFYAIFYGNACCILNSKEKKACIQQKLKSLARFSTIASTTIEIVLCIVYFVFIISTCITLIDTNSTRNLLFSYAQYARQGFFELCYISIINFIVFICIELLNDCKTMRIQVWAKRMLCIETICIIITALMRLGMYIQVYGLTYLRIYSAWFIIVLLGAFLFIGYHSFKKGPYILHIVQYACICFLMLNLVNVDGLIKTVNKEVYKDNVNVQIRNE